MKQGSGIATLIGVALGAVGLALVACFAILLPKAHHDTGEPVAGETASSDAHEPISLPDKLPGGYIASDLPDAFAGSSFDADKTRIAALEAKNRAYADGVLSAVLDEAVATRVYAGPDASTRLSVQAFRATGHAFAPVDLPDPQAASVGGQSTTVYVREDGAACQLTAAPATSPTSGPPTTRPDNNSAVTCQKSEGGVTVQASSQGLELPDLITLMNTLLDDITP